MKTKTKQTFTISKCGRFLVQRLIVTPAQAGVQQVTFSSANKSVSGMLLWVNPDNSRFSDFLLTFILFEFWPNLASPLIRSFTNPISIGFRKRSKDLFCPIDPNSQILTQFTGY